MLMAGSPTSVTVICSHRLPEQLIDAAFLDRVHGYLPGWEVPKITPASLANGGRVRHRLFLAKF